MKFCKQTIGVDISKGAFDAHFLALPLKSDRFQVRGRRKFSNSPKGILAFQSWVIKKREIGTPLIIAMEATGVYHENLAYFLSKKKFHVTVLLPNRVKAFARSYNQYSKTDEIDASVIALMAMERSLEP